MVAAATVVVVDVDGAVASVPRGAGGGAAAAGPRRLARGLARETGVLVRAAVTVVVVAAAAATSAVPVVRVRVGRAVFGRVVAALAAGAVV